MALHAAVTPRLTFNNTDFPPREGYAQRWVGAMTGSGVDFSRLNSAYNEGWRPRHSKTLPNRVYTNPIPSELAQFEEMEGAILVKTLVLMERTLEAHQADVERERIASAQFKSMLKRRVENAPVHHGFSRIHLDENTSRIAIDD